MYCCCWTIQWFADMFNLKQGVKCTFIYLTPGCCSYLQTIIYLDMLLNRSQLTLWGLTHFTYTSRHNTPEKQWPSKDPKRVTFGSPCCTARLCVCVCVHLMKQLMVDVKLTVAFEAIWVGWLWQWVAGMSATWKRIKHGYWRWLAPAGQACA